MREPEFTARNFHSAQFTFPLYRVMREYASVLGVWLRSDSYSIQAHTIVLARVIGLDDARNRLQMIGQMLIRADRHEPIAQPHRHRAAILDLPILPPLSLARYGDKGSISRDGYKREHGSPPGTSIG